MEKKKEFADPPLGAGKAIYTERFLFKGKSKVQVRDGQVVRDLRDVCGEVREA